MATKELNPSENYGMCGRCSQNNGPISSYKSMSFGSLFKYPYLHSIQLKHQKCFHSSVKAGLVSVNDPQDNDPQENERTLVEIACQRGWSCQERNAVKILTEILHLPGVNQHHVDTALKKCAEQTSLDIVICLLVNGATVKVSQPVGFLKQMLERYSVPKSPDAMKYWAFLAAVCDMTEANKLMDQEAAKSHKQSIERTLKLYNLNEDNQDPLTEALLYGRSCMVDDKPLGLRSISVRRVRGLLLQRHGNIFAALEHLFLPWGLKKDILLGFPFSSPEKLPTPGSAYPKGAPFHFTECACDECSNSRYTQTIVLVETHDAIRT